MMLETLTLAEELNDFKDYFEFPDAYIAITAEELGRKEIITKKSQLFRLDDTSWKSISISNLVVRDALEAWINDEIVRNDAIDNITIDTILETIQARCEWSSDQISSIVIILTNMGIEKFKQLKSLKKKTLYALGIPVLLSQELRGEVKRITQSTAEEKLSLKGLGFRLPIVGGPPPVGGLTTEMAGFSITTLNRVRREINGTTYEYDRKCPHKGADLAYAAVEGNYLICPKHKWKFDLTQQGLCMTTPGCSINARITDW